MIATWQQLAAEHVGTFICGLLVGFALSNRYRVVKRNGAAPHRRSTDKKEETDG